MSGRFVVLVVVCVVAFATAACKKKSTEASANEPAKTTTVDSPKATEVPPPSTSAGTQVQGTPVQPATNTVTPAEPLQVETKDILSREPVTQAAQVRHILIGWADIAGPRSDRRALDRTQEDADKLALELLKKVRDGMNMEALMAEYSEDPGSAQTGEPYPVRPDSDFVPEFEALGLRLNVGEAGICRTQFGYHIMKRIQ